MSRNHLLAFALSSTLLLMGCEAEQQAAEPVEAEAEVKTPEVELVAVVPLEAQPLYATKSLSEGPDAASESLPSLLSGGDFENMGALALPWYTRVHGKRDHYTFNIDTTLFDEGTASLRIEQVKPEQWAAAMQRVTPTAAMGQELELTVKLFGDGLLESPGLIYRFKSNGRLGDVGEVRIDVNEVSGAWGKARMRIPMQAGADSLEVGVSHYGAGRLWVDDVTLRPINPL